MFSTLKNFFNSIALVPSGLALAFLLFASIFSHIKIEYEQYIIFKYLAIEDKNDTQAILAFIVGGIFTLTVFSYTMVMNVLNRNINNYSPRLIPLLLSQKHHQIILGFTSGTIIYAMIMSLSLSNTVNDYYPSIAGGLGIIFTIICILLFIYFLHTVSQSVHINHILKDVFELGNKNLNIARERLKNYEIDEKSVPFEHKIYSINCGYLRLPDFSKLEKELKAMNLQLRVEKFVGEFVYEGDLLFTVNKELTTEKEKALRKIFTIDNEVVLEIVDTSIKHYVEVIAKASSPAINDPGTALATINYITQLLQNRFDLIPFLNNIFYRKNSFSYPERSTRNVMITSFTEIYHYCKTDPMLSKAIRDSLERLNSHCNFEKKLTISEIEQD